MTKNRTLATIICETVGSGVLFVDGSDSGFFPFRGIYSPSANLVRASKEFVMSWSRMLPSKMKHISQHDPVTVVDILIRRHGLVLIVKMPPLGEAEAESIDDEGAGATPIITISDTTSNKKNRYRVKGIDAYRLTHIDVINLISAGRVTATTPIKLVGESTRWKPASSYTEFETALKDAGSKGDVATSSDELTREIVGRSTKSGRYKFYSNKVNMPFASSQILYMEDTFDIKLDDIFYWYPNLKSKMPEQTITAKEFFGRLSYGR
jgi:hypothetical protein